MRIKLAKKKPEEVSKVWRVNEDALRGELKKRKFMHARTGPFVSLGIEGDGNVLRRSLLTLHPIW
jgi:hypothetical protein